MKCSIPVTDDGQKLKVMVASNTLPEIITLDRTDPIINLMVKNNQLWSYEDLVKKYAPRFYEVAIKEFKSNYKFPDGKSYFYPSFVEGAEAKQKETQYNGLISTSQPAFLIRSDYLEEIGNPTISTPEELTSALEKIHAKHPDKIAFYGANQSLNGDYVGVEEPMRRISTYFGVTKYYADSKNVMKSVLRNPKMLDTIKFLNQLSNKGLLTKDSFVDQSQVQSQKVDNGDVICFSWTLAETANGPKDNPKAKYVYVKPFKSYIQYRSGNGWTATLGHG